MKISLTMIVRDEVDVLARCLRSCAGLFDEIIITDTGSADATVSEAAKFTDKIFYFNWIDDFSAARNFCLSKATGDYVMWLDADDVIEERDFALFRDLFGNLDRESPDVVMLPYNVGFDGERVTLSYERERIFKNNAGFLFKGAVHEAVAPRGKIIHGKAAVTHKKLTAKNPTRNLKIYEKLLAKQGDLCPRDCYYFARELRAAGRLGEAAAMYKKCADDPSAWPENRVSALFELSETEAVSGDFDRSDAALLRCLTEGEPRADVLCELGRRALERGRLEAAEFWYRLAPAQFSRPLGGFVHADYGGLIPFLQLAVICDRLGRPAEAEAYNEAAAQISPAHPSVIHNREYFANRRGKDSAI